MGGVREVALSAVNGINSSIFAYGQTSSGKTFTMSGIAEYTIANIYDYIEKHKDREYLLKFSAMEIYNESVRDLLSTDSSPLGLLEDPERGTIVENLTEATLRDWDHVQELLSVCEAQRQIGETSLNGTSSRSHQIIRLTIESSVCDPSDNDNISTLIAAVVCSYIERSHSVNHDQKPPATSTALPKIFAIGSLLNRFEFRHLKSDDLDFSDDSSSLEGFLCVETSPEANIQCHNQWHFMPLSLHHQFYISVTSLRRE